MFSCMFQSAAFVLTVKLVIAIECASSYWIFQRQSLQNDEEKSAINMTAFVEYFYWPVDGFRRLPRLSQKPLSFAVGWRDAEYVNNGVHSKKPASMINCQRGLFRRKEAPIAVFFRDIELNSVILSFTLRWPNLSIAAQRSRKTKFHNIPQSSHWKML